MGRVALHLQLCSEMEEQLETGAPHALSAAEGSRQAPRTPAGSRSSNDPNTPVANDTVSAVPAHTAVCRPAGSCRQMTLVVVAAAEVESQRGATHIQRTWLPCCIQARSSNGKPRFRTQLTHTRPDQGCMITGVRPLNTRVNRLSCVISNHDLQPSTAAQHS